jgi:hypothetical protein
VLFAALAQILGYIGTLFVCRSAGIKAQVKFLGNRRGVGQGREPAD